VNPHDRSLSILESVIVLFIGPGVAHQRLDRDGLALWYLGLATMVIVGLCWSPEQDEAESQRRSLDEWNHLECRCARLGRPLVEERSRPQSFKGVSGLTAGIRLQRQQGSTPGASDRGLGATVALLAFYRDNRLCRIEHTYATSSQKDQQERIRKLDRENGEGAKEEREGVATTLGPRVKCHCLR
jgi:hypothetical protein